MKKNKKIILISIIALILVILTIYTLKKDKKYEYICLNKELLKEEYIYDFILETCTSNKKLPEGVITKKEELLSDSSGKYYKLIQDSYKEGEMLYKEDFALIDTSIEVEQEVPLLKELEVITTAEIKNGLPINNLETPIKYKIYIKDSKVYAINLNNNKEEVIFDKEKVKNIAVRPYCCTGNGKLLVLTTKGNLYISKYDCNYFFSFDFPFEKLNTNDVVSIKLVPKDNNDLVKSLYIINSKEEEIFIEEPTWQ